MPDDAGFLRAILATPADDLPRLVYADWLDEQGTDDASRKAEFLRLTAALLMETNSTTRTTFEKRLADLARHLPTDWLPVVSRLTVENCAAAGNAVHHQHLPVSFEYECPLAWESLAPTSDPAVRQCDSCERKVYYSATIGEAREFARRGQCVAVDVAIPRAAGDLQPVRLMLGRLSVAASQRWRAATEVDEVSAEREVRRGAS